jgi:hypothetical protein
MFDISQDQNVSLGIARNFSPMDTGNVKFNATQAHKTNDGFVVSFSLADAYYIYFLEEGTRKSTQHQGYIANKIVPGIANYLHTKYARKNKKQTRKIENISRRSLEPRGITQGMKRRHERSLAIDVDKVAEANAWKHESSIEQYDKDWQRVDFF